MFNARDRENSCVFSCQFHTCPRGCRIRKQLCFLLSVSHLSPRLSHTKTAVFSPVSFTPVPAAVAYENSCVFSCQFHTCPRGCRIRNFKFM
ncbi:hypothetical protein ACOMHN_028346 [Nucella lapillus]